MKDTSQSRLARPRRRFGSVCLLRTEFLQEMFGANLEGATDQQNLDFVARTTDGEQRRRASGNMDCAAHNPTAEQRIDGAHGSLPKHCPRSQKDESNAARDGRVAPRRCPSFASLLRSDTLRSHTQSGIRLSEEHRSDLYETSIAYDVGVFEDAGFRQDAGIVDAESAALASRGSVGAKNEDSSSLEIDNGPTARSCQIEHCRDLDGQPTTGEVGVGAEDWLSLQAADLIRRIQIWLAELSAKDTQLVARISLQEQRERRFRALCDGSVPQA